MSDLKSMTIGEIVDFVIDYNNRNKSDDEKKSDAIRKATQADINSFFGG